jgi:hypothetical protein
LKRHVGQFGGGFDEHAIQIGARHRMDHFLRPHAVHLQFGGAVEFVHHAAAHGDGERHDAIEHAGEREPANAARRECQIDGAAVIDHAAARIGAAFVDGHLESALRQENGQQRSGEPGADDVHAALRRFNHRSSVSVKMPRNLSTAVTVMWFASENNEWPATTYGQVASSH